MDPHDVAASAGTYLKVVQFGGKFGDDAFLVLYLRPHGRFLMAGYWAGYERSFATGRWVQTGSEMRLEGRGRVSGDVLPSKNAERFERILNVGDLNHTPCLIAAEELEGWSLLSWRGPYSYVGRQTIIDPDGRWLPASISAVDALIDTVA